MFWVHYFDGDASFDDMASWALLSYSFPSYQALQTFTWSYVPRLVLINPKVINTILSAFLPVSFWNPVSLRAQSLQLAHFSCCI